MNPRVCNEGFHSHVFLDEKGIDNFRPLIDYSILKLYSCSFKLKVLFLCFLKSNLLNIF